MIKPDLSAIQNKIGFGINISEAIAIGSRAYVRVWRDEAVNGVYPTGILVLDMSNLKNINIAGIISAGQEISNVKIKLDK